MTTSNLRARHADDLRAESLAPSKREGAFAFVSFLVLATAAACGSEDGSHLSSTESDVASTTPGDRREPTSSGERPTSGTGGEPTSSDSPERAVAKRLGLAPRFSIGTGNDANGNDPNAALGLRLGPSIDIHYMYLSGTGWPSWTSTEGQYVLDYARAAKARGVVPMFTLYQAASAGEGNFGDLGDWNFMERYWKGVRVLFQRLGEFGAPAIVHLEPDVWGSAQQASENPSEVFVHVGEIVPECSDLPKDISGMARCEIRLARNLAPKTLVGLSASTFGAYDDDGKSDPVRIGQYLKKIGGDEADITVLETLDRDAGCFEAGDDSNCQRSGSFYWDENNERHPNFHDHLAWAKTIREVVGKPLLWWQMPLGVPNDWSGWESHYRDNRVRYLFAHADEFVAAGGFAAVFGPGAERQTTLATDEGQFEKALTGYLTSPASLP